MRAPDGVETYLEADGPGGQHATIGGIIAGRADDRVTVRARVHGGAGTELLVIADGTVVARAPIDTGDETVTTHVPVHAGYVRAEVRRPSRRRGSPTEQETLTNPIWFEPGGSADDPTG
jgi:hypothetical protein